MVGAVRSNNPGGLSPVDPGNGGARELQRKLWAAAGGPAFPPKGYKPPSGIARADAIVASTPVYKAGISGLFKWFVHLLDNDLLVAKPVLLAATAGSSRHALVVDDQMRPHCCLHAALTLPHPCSPPPRTGAPQSSASASGAPRPSSPSSSTRRPSSGSPIAPGPATRHQFAGNATRAEQSATDIDFDSPLMRLAAGGRTTQDATDSDPGDGDKEITQTG